MNRAEQRTYFLNCRYIFSHYGREAQKRQLIQELSELITALTKNDLENTIEEMADVQVMLDQFKINDYKILREMSIIQQKKVLRQLERIKQGEEIKNDFDGGAEGRIKAFVSRPR